MYLKVETMVLTG